MAKYSELRPDNTIGTAINNELSTYLDPDEYDLQDNYSTDGPELKNDIWQAVGNALSGQDIEVSIDVINKSSFTGLLIPFYVYPSNGINNTTYNDFIDLKKGYHEVPTIVILNPSNGPGASVDGNYTVTIKRLKGAGCKVVGYVSTAYMANAIADVKSDIDDWYSFYTEIDGIFFDELEHTSPISDAVKDYYQEVRDYTRAKGGSGSSIVIMNPGTTVPKGYYDNELADIIVVYETDSTTNLENVLKYDNAAGTDYNDSAHMGYHYEKRGALLYGQASWSQINFEILEKYTGWVYYTEDTLPNPWDSLSTHITDIFEALAAVNTTVLTELYGKFLQLQYANGTDEKIGVVFSQDDMFIAQNADYDGTNWNSIEADRATRIGILETGDKAFIVQTDTSVSGADETLSWSDIVSVDYSGNMTIGGTINDGAISETAVTQHEAAIDHNQLTNYASDEHFKQTDITYVDTAFSTGLLKVTTGTGALSVITDSSSNWDAAYSHISADGSSHTYIDQDVTSGSSPTFDGTNFSGVPASALPDADDDGVTKGVSTYTNADFNVTAGLVSIEDSGVDHDATTNFVSNEHIDHTSVTLTAGNGLSGGGDISANRSFALDLNELGVETGIAAGDYVAMVDVTDNGSQKITFANFESALNHDNLTGFVADEHVAHSGVTLTAGTGLTGGGTIASNRSFALSHLGLESLVDPNVDCIFAWDDSAGASAWLQMGSGASIDATPALQIDHDAANNFVADEHVAHSGVSVLAGTLLTGGGTIDGNVTLNVDEASIDHGSIAGTGDDDHTQYLLVDGTRAMTGALLTDSGIGITGDTDLLSLAANALTVNGTIAVASSATDQVATFTSTDDAGYIRISDDDTNVYVGAKDSAAWFGLSSPGSTSGTIAINANGLGVGTSPSSITKVSINMSTGQTADQSGVYVAANHISGASDHNDDLTGYTSNLVMNDSDGEIGYLRGECHTLRIDSGNIGDAVNTRSIYGTDTFCDFNGGTVNANAHGFHFEIDQEAANTITGDIAALYASYALDGTVSGTAYGIYITGETANYLSGTLETGGAATLDSVVTSTIGSSGDTDLLGLAADSLTLNGQAEIISTSTQLTLTHTDGVDETTLATDASGYFEITPTGEHAEFVDSTLDFIPYHRMVDTGLVAYWSLNDVELDTVDYEYKDNSGNDHTATASGALMSTDGPAGPCVDLDGTSDYLTVTSDGTGTYDVQAFSICAWVRTDTLTDYLLLWSYDYTSHVEPYYAQHLRVLSNGHVYFGWNDGSSHNALVSSDGAISTGTWHFVVATFESGSQHIYIDGVDVAQGNSADTITYYSQEVWIGKANFTVSKACRIAHVRFLSRVLSQGEIRWLYQNPAGNVPEMMLARRFPKELTLNTRLELVDSANEQLRLTHTATTNYADFTVDGDGDLDIAPSGDYFTISGVNVGIGTDLPIELFHVWAEDGNYMVIETDSGTAYQGGLLISNDLSLGSTESSFKITSSFNSGSSAAARLGFIDNDDKETFLNSGPGLEFKYDGNILLAQGAGNVGVRTTVPDVEFQVGNGAAAGFSTTPDVRMQVSSTTEGAEVAYQLYVQEGTNNRRAKFFLDDATGEYGFDTTYTTNTAEFVIKSVGTEGFRLGSNRNVGINQSSPSAARLEVLDASNPQLRLTHTDDADYVDHTVDASGNYLIDATGEIRLGTTSNYTEFESDGTVVFNGDATVWDDIRVPVFSIQRLGDADPDWEQFQDDGAGSVGVYALAFADSIDQEGYFSVQIPHGWKLGSDLNPHVHWSPPSTDTGSVTWKLEYTIADINGTFGNTSTLSVTDAGDGTAYKHQYADLGDIDMSSYTNSDDISIIILCRIYRDVDDGDDYSGDAFLLEVDFHYEIDTVGSRSENTK